MEEYWEVLLDYPIRPSPRYGYGKPPHARLHTILDRDRSSYEATLRRILDRKDGLLGIPVDHTGVDEEPYWRSGWLPGLDVAALYVLLAELEPARYVEVGSGTSTQFARRAIRDHDLGTEIVSIDPHPRAEIDALCDRLVRQPLEDVDLTLFDNLVAGDIVFVDNSHRCFMNSDATVMFLDVLPRLAPGVHVEFHDICLPWDYPPEYADRFYSEQYLLACYLLAEGSRFDVILPNWFVSHDPDLPRVLQPLWAEAAMSGVESHGSSFWLKVN